MKKTKWLAACMAACALALVAGCSNDGPMLFDILETDEPETDEPELPGIEYDAEKWVINGTTVVSYTGAEADVRVPDGVTAIGDSAFEGCTSLEEVKYGGTEEQWKQIDIDSGAFPSDAKITDKDGNEISYP